MYNIKIGEALNTMGKELSGFSIDINHIKNDLDIFKNFKENTILSIKDLNNDLFKRYSSN